MVAEFRILSTGLARERVGTENPADVLQDVLKDLKANVDCLGLNYDVMLASFFTFCSLRRADRRGGKRR